MGGHRDRAQFREEFLNKYRPRPGGRSESRGSGPRDSRGPRPSGDGKPVHGRGSFQKSNKGFGFVVFDTIKHEDLFIPPDQTENLFHGDRVEVQSDARGNIRQLKVIDRRIKEIVGRAQISWSGQSLGILYQNKNLSELIPVVEQAEGLSKPKHGDWVRAKLKTSENGKASASLVEVYGPTLPASADIQMIAGEFGWIEHHSEAAHQEAQRLVAEPPRVGDPGREDFTHVPFITIDGERARDFDDAVHVERAGESFILWVAIADVAHYVRKGGKIDEEALMRATSVYFPERAFHMLPHELSEGLCSLRPNELRYGMVIKSTINVQGKRTRTEVYNGLIRSRRRATYTEIQAEYEKLGESTGWEYKNYFDLYKVLRRMRQKRGSIDFEFPESEVVCAPNGEPTSIDVVARVDAHRLIEEFMISANEAIADWTLSRHQQFIFRVHEEPNPVKLEAFVRLANGLGVELPELENIDSLAVSRLLQSFADHPAKTLLSTMLLRSLKQAVYSADLAIHFGLASEGYTHFTSPIRRYPDLIAHRIVKEILAHGKTRETNESVAKLAEHCSYRERLSGETEMESRKLKQVRLMMKELGNEFEGMINGTHKKGIFVQLAAPYVEGFIPIETLTDDDYLFNEEHLFLYGRRKKRMFRVGDRLRVQVVNASLEMRRIEFELLEKLEEAPSATPARQKKPR